MRINGLFFIFAAAATLALGACEKPDPAPELLPQAGYVGTLDVIEIGDALFHMDDVLVGYELGDDGVLDILMHDVNFSSRMPYPLSLVVLPDVSYTRSGNVLKLSGTDIIPMMEMRGQLVPYELYLCTDLTGTINPEQLVLSMKLGGYQTDYSGSYREE